MIKKIWHVPVTEESHPFAQAERHCHLKEKGYLEEEYFSKAQPTSMKKQRKTVL